MEVTDTGRRDHGLDEVDQITKINDILKFREPLRAEILKAMARIIDRQWKWNMWAYKTVHFMTKG